MRIAIDGHSLRHCGGIEHLTCKLASALADRGHAVFLFTCDPPLQSPIYPLHPAVLSVRHTYTGDSRELHNFRQQIRACAPDVCLSPASGPQHLIWCAALWETDIPWIYSEHGNPAFIQGHLWNSEERLAAMTGADAIHLLLEGFRDSVPAFLQDRVHVIPNPLVLEPVTRRKAKRDGYTLLALSRLVENKQNILLIQAFAQLAPHFPKWKLEIWGQGEERPRLEKAIRASHMQERITLCGETGTPQAQYAAADLFCTPSRVEGFGLTAIEAMSCGLPVVGFAGCSGINELVRHRETGLLAPEMNAQSLAQTLRILMADENLRRTMGERAEKAARTFAPAPIYDRWEALLAATAARRGVSSLHRLHTTELKNTEEKRHYICLRACIQRQHVFLADSDWLRLFIWRHPALREVIRPIRRIQRWLFHFFRRRTDGEPS